MEHPLIPNLSGLTVDELSSKINELSKKLGIAQQTGNGYLCIQIRMALESYQNIYSQRLQEQYNKDLGQAPDFNDKIQIQ
jgi:hypothetical protein